MRPFTDEEFDIMIRELTDESGQSFDMLCAIADKTLRSSVKRWCEIDPTLRYRAEENGIVDEIMQEIFIRLIKRTTYGFLLRGDGDGKINRNPDGFKSWMFKVAKNIKADVSNEYRARDFKWSNIEDEENRIEVQKQDGDKNEDYSRERLTNAFSIVLNADRKVYIILTWLAQCLLVLSANVSKIKVTRFMEDHFSEKTLFEIRDIVLLAAETVEWLDITETQLGKINDALNEVYEGDLIGNYKYKDFYMKKGGAKSISDWTNRINEMIDGILQ